MAATSKPNRALARVLEEAGMSRKRLAAEVRARSVHDRKFLSTDHNAVRRWLEGMQPKEEAALAVAAVLSVRLGRTVTPAALGFTSPAPPESPARSRTTAVPVAYATDVAGATAALGAVAADDIDDVNVETLRRWDAHASPSIISGFLFDAPSSGMSLGTHDEPFDATVIRRTTASLTSLDFQLGGGHTRQLLLNYFSGQVLPLLRRASDIERTAEIFSATAELAQMLGWSAYDSGRQGAAQRYLVHGLRLAREAEDHLLGAFILSSLSHQANYLGHFRDAVQLARAGQHQASLGTSPTVESMLFAYEARALASLGDQAGCARALHRAETSFDTGRPTDDPEWLWFFDRAELAGEAAHCFRDLRDPAARGFCIEAVASAETPPRTRAFIGMVSAMAALHAGDLDEATSMATSAVKLAGPIDSGRYRRYVTDFLRVATSQYPRDPRISDLIAYASPLTLNGQTLKMESRAGRSGLSE